MTTILKPIRWNDDRATTHHAFGLRDPKGREWGANVSTWTETVLPGPVPEHGGWRCSELPVGVHYAVDVHVARDGENYGASHRAHYFTTPARRDAFVAKRLAEVADRQRAKLGKTVVPKPAAAPVAEPAKPVHRITRWSAIASHETPICGADKYLNFSHRTSDAEAVTCPDCQRLQRLDTRENRVAFVRRLVLAPVEDRGDRLMTTADALKNDAARVAVNILQAEGFNATAHGDADGWGIIVRM